MNGEECRELINKFVDMDKTLQEALVQSKEYESNIKKATKELIDLEVEKILKAINIEEINRGDTSVRVSLLKKAGVKTYLDVYKLQSVSKLQKINGISHDSAYQIIKDVYDTEKQIRQNVNIGLSRDNRSTQADNLVRALYVFKESQLILQEGKELFNLYHSKIAENTTNAKIITQKFKWFFASSKTKDLAQKSAEELKELEKNRFIEKATFIVDTLSHIKKVSKNKMWESFENNSANYYSLLEKLNILNSKNTEISKGLPKTLAEQIDALELNLNGLKCTLRNYQEFGVKYILHQGFVLLGDEMGLGKTVQAIASMVALRNYGETHFLVVCPASVLINWCREIEHHSDLKAIKLHGDNRDKTFKEWLKCGGVAVTTYETMAKFDFKTVFNIGLLVADEAHYAKNPEANRTNNLMDIKDRAQRALFMTGTPLENKVEEMLYLISCLNPEVAETVKDMQHLSKASIFREKIASVYFRRTREDVLKELPDLIETEEWCEMGEEERKDYFNSTMAHNFMAMRQVSWRMDDLTKSSKCQRLIEICEKAKEEKRKIIVFSYFLNTIKKVQELFKENCYGPINGSVEPIDRQKIIDDFTKSKDGSVLVAQIQAGGTGLNIQAASCVVLCEPQLKPSTENQAISRTYRMGQTRNVQVFKLLCEDSVDERIVEILNNKEVIFDNFADKSTMGKQSIEITKKQYESIVNHEVERLNNQSKK